MIDFRETDGNSGHDLRQRTLPGAVGDVALGMGRRSWRRAATVPVSVLIARGDPWLLLAAELVVVGCPVDGREHLVDDRMHVEVLAAFTGGRVGAPSFEALCGRMLIPDSLTAGPRPACPECAQEAGPRWFVACERLAYSRQLRRFPTRRGAHLVREMWAQVESILMTTLTWLREVIHVDVSRWPDASKYVLSSGARVRRSTGPGGLA